MKSYLLFILCLCLAGTIVAPSFISLMDVGDEIELALDQGQEKNKKENKEGEKESNDKDCFFYYGPHTLSGRTIYTSEAVVNYMEGPYEPALNVFLPPPKFS